MKPLDPEGSQASIEIAKSDKQYLPGQSRSLSGIAVRAFCLGSAFTVGVIAALTIAIYTSSSLWRLPFFLATLSTFHFLEFWTQARYNTRVATMESFIFFGNGSRYFVAHTAAAVECLLSSDLFFQGLSFRSWLPYPLSGLLTLFGLFIVFASQIVRSVAMAQAGPSFNHAVQETRKTDHVLVTSGLYSRVRHPSYFGYYWWVIGIQLALGNSVCLVAFFVVLHMFYSERIPREEKSLVEFFGTKYVDYRRKVGTGIPFVG